MDADRRFYFLEMNTRLQVEHPVTELVTGLDLVKLQVEIAGRSAIAIHAGAVAWRGSAIECRIYAEDPYNDFLPFPGKLTRLSRPLGPGVRLDGCVYDGWTVPMEYDPLLAKLAVFAATREQAIQRMIRALREYDVGGIRTNIGFFRQILEDPNSAPPGCIPVSSKSSSNGTRAQCAAGAGCRCVAGRRAALLLAQPWAHRNATIRDESVAEEGRRGLLR